MTEAMSEAMSAIKNHAPTLPSPGDVREAVQSHLPSVDMDTVRDKAPGKRSLITMLIGLLAGAAVVAGVLRQRRAQSESASAYTPPLPRP